ncbi:hypothetical protein [Amycolatopsis sp. CA-230715]|uniref:hypothetical protein n=1 Tax=Amycolatopsis sp. CA-230715 TaxID=2745196 RepID=UPI001C00EDB7|nr:hypothetical protein [Amycolatopsis sp. CA-230715]QWF85617.1 hypothetical protein HUW46_09072 [Amycolatopsis sp. CA-230715]
MTSIDMDHDTDVDDEVRELDRATAGLLIAHIHTERDGGTFGGMDGDSPANWIIGRIGHLLEHPEDIG